MILFKKKYLFTIVYSLLLIIFTSYILMDTFIFSEVYDVTDNYSEEIKEKDIINNKKVITDTSYKDNNISININTYREYETNIYVADIVLGDASYLKTAFAKNAYGKNIVAKTSEIAESNNAILAINGDYYGVQEKGYVLKNGQIYRTISKNNQEDLIIYKNGNFDTIIETETDINDLINNEVYNLLSFGPSLIVNGNINVNKNTEVGKAMSSNPRTAIGIIDELHYVFVVSDGRTNENKGLSLYHLATFMNKFNVKLLYNLDGGGSSTMYFNGNIINNPTTNGKTIKERSVSDIVYIGY